jgi:MFS transporter, AAHS family, cis,cis-muconate transporter
MIPAFVLPAAVLLVVIGHLDDPSSLFWLGLAANFLSTGSYRTRLGYNAELFPTQIRGTAVGAALTLSFAAAALSPAIMGGIATYIRSLPGFRFWHSCSCFWRRCSFL